MKSTLAVIPHRIRRAGGRMLRMVLPPKPVAPPPAPTIVESAPMELHAATPTYHRVSRWQDVPASVVPDTPGMTAIDELRFLYWACSQAYTGRGRVVELGPFAGRSTNAMAAGLLASAHPETKVVSFDCHQWDEWAVANYVDPPMAALTAKQRAELPAHYFKPKVGDSFRWLFDIYTEPYSQAIDAHSVDLDSHKWTGEPIEILFVDAAKSWATLDQILREYFTCLMDEAIVIHQDYKHAYTYWLHPVTERMLEDGLLTELADVDSTPSMVYRFHRPAKLDLSRYMEAAFTAEQTEALLRRSASRFPSHERPTVQGALLRYLNLQNEKAKSRKSFHEAILQPGMRNNFALAYELLGNAGDWHTPLFDMLKEKATLSGPSTTDESQPAQQWATGLICPVGNSECETTLKLPGIEAPAGESLVFQISAEASCVSAQVRVAYRSATGDLLQERRMVLLPGERRAVAAEGLRGMVDVEISTSAAKPAGDAVVVFAPMLVR